MAAIGALVTPIALPLHSAAHAPDQREFEVGRGVIGGFDVRARTEVDWRGETPFISKVECTGDNQDIRFLVDETGALKRLDFTFRGLPEPDGERPEITLLGDSLWLIVDGKRYEHRNIARATNRFTNHSYPATHNETAMVLPWRGHRSVRASDADPFMNMSRIYGDIVRARKVEWAFKSRNWNQVDRSVPENALPLGWQTRRYPINNRDLKAAVEWCVKAVASDTARQLPSGFVDAER